MVRNAVLRQGRRRLDPPQPKSCCRGQTARPLQALPQLTPQMARPRPANSAEYIRRSRWGPVTAAELLPGVLLPGCAAPGFGAPGVFPPGCDPPVGFGVPGPEPAPGAVLPGWLPLEAST